MVLVSLVESQFPVHCKCCGRSYTREEWSMLPPARNGLHKKDEWEHTEWRNCPNPCNSTHMIILEIYKTDEG